MDDNVYEHIDRLRSDVTAKIDRQSTSLQSRIDTLGDRIAEKLERTTADLATKVAEISATQRAGLPRLEKVETAVDELRSRPDNSVQVIDHEHRIGSLEEDAARPAPAVAALEVRVRTIEDNAHETAGAAKTRKGLHEALLILVGALVSGGGVALIAGIVR